MKMKMSADHFLALLFVALLRCEGTAELEPPQHRHKYHYFVLSMRWPNTYCENPSHRCRKSLPQNFTLHGLWPNRFDGSKIPCSSVTSLPDSVLMKYEKGLLEYWPDLTQTNFEKSKPFWRREYKKHGACCTEKFDADEYIERAIRLAKTHDLLEYLKSRNILPNDLPYNPRSILAAIEAQTGYQAVIRCSTLNPKVYLEEVRICINYNGGRVINCPGGNVISCPRNPYFPSSVSSMTAMDGGDESVAETTEEKNDTDQVLGWEESKGNHEDGFSSM